MTLEGLSNYGLLTLFKMVVMVTPGDTPFIDEIQEEIFSRMEVEGA